MKHNMDLDQILEQALSPENEPDYWLNQKILRKAKENEGMIKKYNKRIPAVALTMVLTLSIGSLTAVAAWKYLTPDKIAEVAEDDKLAAAFRSKDAIEINEAQEYGNYKITLLGVVSGKNLSQYISERDGEIKEDQTYAVTAIENADGTPRPATSDEMYGEDPLFVSPLIKGQNPAKYNIATMGGGYTEIVRDGVQYRITECDNVEKFANRGLYLCVSSSVFYDWEAYNFNESTGEITRNEAYDGVNALFDLPLDDSKADEAAAEAYIKEKEQPPVEDEISPEADEMSQMVAEIEAWGEEELGKHATLLEEITQVITPDKDGNISYQYQIGKDGPQSKSTVNLDFLFEGNEMFKFNQIMSGDDTGNEFYIETLTRNADETVTLKVYRYNK